MLTALILICSLNTTPDVAACDQSNAVDSMKVPDEFGTPVACLMQGQAFLAQTELGRDMASDERVKVVCVRSARKAASTGLILR